MNKKGVTLMELIAYLALVGIIITLLTSTMTYAIRSYDKVGGQGALYTEANFIMSNLITQANVFSPDYVRECGDNCLELVKEKEKYIDEDLGIIKERPSNKLIQIKLIKNSDYSNDVYDIYMGSMKLNNRGYALNPVSLINSTNKNNINYQCYDSENLTNNCQKFVLYIRLSLYRINKNGDRISKDYEFENQFSF